MEVSLVPPNAKSMIAAKSISVSPTLDLPLSSRLTYPTAYLTPLLKCLIGISTLAKAVQSRNLGFPAIFGPLQVFPISAKDKSLFQLLRSKT